MEGGLTGRREGWREEEKRFKVLFMDYLRVSVLFLQM